MKAKIIVFMGIDGSGKSSTCISVRDALRARGYRVVTIHHAPPIFELLHRSLRGTTTDEPDDRPSLIDGDITPRRQFIRILIGVLAYIDALVGRSRILNAVGEADILICDRYPYDHLAYYISDAPRLLTRLFTAICPHPALTFLVDVPPEVAYARRPEGSFDSCTRNTQRFRSIANRDLVRNLVVLDNTRPHVDVVSDAIAMTLKVV